MSRGKKVCPECNAEVGVRTKQCECGHVFSFKQPSSSGANVAVPTKEQLLAYYAVRKFVDCFDGNVTRCQKLLDEVIKFKKYPSKYILENEKIDRLLLKEGIELLDKVGTPEVAKQMLDVIYEVEQEVDPP